MYELCVYCTVRTIAKKNRLLSILSWYVVKIEPRDLPPYFISFRFILALTQYSCVKTPYVWSMLLSLFSHNTHKLQFSLYIHAGSPSITSLTYHDQSRTLTCTSAGGPATTVTWRRNGVVITHNATYQQTKSLVDPFNGTYQTVLTIDPSLGQSSIVGTYNCTVENNRGNSSEMVVVQGETWTIYSRLI